MLRKKQRGVRLLQPRGCDAMGRAAGRGRPRAGPVPLLRAAFDRGRGGVRQHRQRLSWMILDLTPS